MTDHNMPQGGAAREYYLKGKKAQLLELTEVISENPHMTVEDISINAWAKIEELDELLGE